MCNGYGGTEFGNPVLSWDKITRDDWSWFRIREDANVRFEDQRDGMYELVVVVSDHYYVGSQGWY